MQQIVISNEESYSMEPTIYPVRGGVLEITLPKISAILLKAVPSREKQQQKAKEAIRSNQRIY